VVNDSGSPPRIMTRRRQPTEHPSRQPRAQQARRPASHGSRATWLLVLAVLACLVLLWLRPWRPPQPTEAGVRARIEAYTAMRKADDWLAVYDLLDPADRARVRKEEFLRLYATGALRVHDARVEHVHIEGSRATVDMVIDGELVLERLPDAARRGLNIQKPEDLRQGLRETFEWVFRDGQWYLRIDREVRTGRDQKGRVIRAIPEKVVSEKK
jgi:hypothetical protein